ncbi:MAG: hypothetical protein ACLUD2_17185 [Clostridium sp.]
MAMGNTRYSFLFGIMRKVLILVPLALILPHFIGVWEFMRLKQCPIR